MDKSDQAEPDLLISHIKLMEHSVNDLIERVNIADAILHRTRVIGIALIVSFLMIIGTVFYQVTSSGKSTHDVCTAQNELRAGNRILWGNVLDQSPVPALVKNATAQQIADYERQVKVTNQFKQDLKTYFSPIDC